MPEIEIEGPDGDIFAFPEGTSDGVMRTALLKHYQTGAGKGWQDRVKVTTPAAAPVGPGPQSATDMVFGGEDPAPTVAAQDMPGARLAGSVDAGVRSVANGMTLGLGDRLAAAAGAATGIGGTFGDYSGNLARQQAATKQVHEEHPVAALAGDLVGAAALPLGVAGAAAQRAGLLGKAAIGMGTGGAIGAVQGAASAPDLTQVGDAAARAATGGSVGALIGAGMPVVAKGIGAGYRAVKDRLTAPAIEGVDRAAAGELVRAVDADGPDAVRAALTELGPQGMMADAGPSLTGLAQGVAMKPGEAKSSLVAALSERNKGVNDRVQAEVNATLGPAESPGAVKQAIEDTRQAVTAPLFAQAERAPVPAGAAMDELAARPAVERSLNRAGEIAANEGRALPIITRDEAGKVVANDAAAAFAAGSRARIDGALGNLLGRDGALATAEQIVARRSAEAAPLYEAARAAEVPVSDGMVGLLRRLQRSGAFAQAQQKMAIQGEAFDIGRVQTWDYMKRALDDRIGAAQRKGAKDDARIFTGLKRELTDEIDAAVPAYAEARQAFSGESDLLGALEAGKGVWSQTYTREQLKADLKGLTSGEQEMFRLGAANGLRERLANTGDKSDLPHAVFGNQALREKIGALAPDAGAMKQFNAAIINEHREFSQAAQPNLQAWKNAYDQLTDQAARLGDTAAGRAVAKARDAMREKLETVPALKAALAKNDEYARLQAAVDRGGNVLDNGKTAIRPEDLTAELAGMSGPERAALAVGSRAEIDRAVGTKANDLVALKGILQGDGGWNTQKIGAVHGDEAAERLVGAVSREARMRDTHTKVIEGSQSAQRLAARDALADAPAPKPPSEVKGTTALGLALAVPRWLGTKAYGALGKVDNTARDAQIAEALGRQGYSAEGLLSALLAERAQGVARGARAEDVGNRSAIAAGLLGSAVLAGQQQRR